METRWKYDERKVLLARRIEDSEEREPRFFFFFFFRALDRLRFKLTIGNKYG